ncbi:MAG: hypothetical protein RLO52_32450 [Sandaracinaceae bacterium]|nr:MAG: hypothetical protein EVA89_34270 [Sandaracinaceae bacterium]HBQ09797.1 hypothetical protein [Myxococcales bacterium]
MSLTFHAELTWSDAAGTGLCRRLRLDEATEAFGLLERDGDGWSLCIPDGAEAEARVDERPLDLRTLFLDPSGERRLPLRAGLEARVLMGGFRFELRPDAAA